MVTQRGPDRGRGLRTPSRSSWQTLLVRQSTPARLYTSVRKPILKDAKIHILNTGPS